MNARQRRAYRNRTVQDRIREYYCPPGGARVFNTIDDIKNEIKKLEENGEGVALIVGAISDKLYHGRLQVKVENQDLLWVRKEVSYIFYMIQYFSLELTSHIPLSEQILKYLNTYCKAYHENQQSTTVSMDADNETIWIKDWPGSGHRCKSVARF